MIIQADILQWAETYEGEPFHAVLCDPPYGLNESELDIGAVLVDWLADREHQPKGAGFMGRAWDCFIPGPRIWRAIRRCCAPGAFLFAFGGTRTADLLGLALRLAGWEKRDQIDWCYGSGFPKNQNISKAIDRAAKADRPIVGVRAHQPKFDAKGFDYRKKDNGFNSKDRATFDVTTAATPLAVAWDGYGTALKPAHEPILVFRNPLRGTYAENCTATGAGALNIDAARIGRAAGDRFEYGVDGDETAINQIYGVLPPHPYNPHAAGRWPANLILQHTPDCNGTCVPDCPIERLGAQSGESEYPRHKTKRSATKDIDGMQYSGGYSGQDDVEVGFSDRGTAARFFFQVDWMLDRLEDADPVVYRAKASRSEREAGLDPRQVRLLGLMEQDTATINDGREKPIDNPYQRGETTRRNTHPTLKPLSLARYLAALLLPPAMYAPRRLLVPFAGAGSECIGAELAGWEEVVGVELEAQHCQIAEARLAYWRQRRHEYGDPAKEIRAVLTDAPDGQLDMFGGSL
jgi:DNA modification methylase